MNITRRIFAPRHAPPHPATTPARMENASKNLYAHDPAPRGYGEIAPSRRAALPGVWRQSLLVVLATLQVSFVRVVAFARRDGDSRPHLVASPLARSAHLRANLNPTPPRGVGLRRDDSRRRRLCARLAVSLAFTFTFTFTHHVMSSLFWPSILSTTLRSTFGCASG